MSLFENKSLVNRNSNPLNVWQKEMNNLLDRFSSDFVTELDATGITPKVEIKEKDKHYKVSVEIPGMNENDINVTLKENSLVLEGERKSESKKEEDGYYSSEFSYGSFYRSIPLSEEVNPDSVKASYKNGILTIDLDKIKSSSQNAKKIPILKS